MIRAAIAITLAAAASAAIAGDAPVSKELARELAGRTPGQPQDCITLSTVQGPGLYEPDAIVYRDGPRLWVTHPIGTCTTLHPLDTLIVEVWGGRLCRRDKFRTVTPGTSIPSGYCFFDQFTPYQKVKR